MTRTIPLHVTVYGESRDEVLDSGEFDAAWEDGRLFIRWRGARYPLRCERHAGQNQGQRDWIRDGDEPRPDDRFFIYYDD